MDMGHVRLVGTLLCAGMLGCPATPERNAAVVVDAGGGDTGVDVDVTPTTDNGSGADIDTDARRRRRCGRDGVDGRWKRRGAGPRDHPPTGRCVLYGTTRRRQRRACRRYGRWHECGCRCGDTLRRRDHIVQWCVREHGDRRCQLQRVWRRVPRSADMPQREMRVPSRDGSLRRDVLRPEHTVPTGDVRLPSRDGAYP